MQDAVKRNNLVEYGMMRQWSCFAILPFVSPNGGGFMIYEKNELGVNNLLNVNNMYQCSIFFAVRWTHTQRERGRLARAKCTRYARLFSLLLHTMLNQS
jgi:hypothetical protein